MRGRNLMFCQKVRTMRRSSVIGLSFAILAVLALGGCADRTRSTAATASSVSEMPAAPSAPPVARALDVQGEFMAAAGSDRVFFDFDSAILTPAAQATLRRQADWLNRNPDVALVIEGHCDERGTREYNLGLGERRAAAARAYLVSLGVTSSRIRTISYGKERPEVVGSTEQAHAQNRRAVTIVSRPGA
jgi:peptidoglycan-associated lipoprotein